MNEWVRLPFPIKNIAEQNTLFAMFGDHNVECRRQKGKVGSQNKWFFEFRVPDEPKEKEKHSEGVHVAR